jgi:GNAT superfamily N-acetyltransferase
MPPEITIETVDSETGITLIMDLFREYFAWVQNEMQFDLSYQDVENELINLPGAYSPPQGCLLLARSEGRPAGCIAFRTNSPGICELKRMYVRPAYRGKGIGRLLCDQIIQSARLGGFHKMRLDTEISLKVAQQIYKDFGFYPTQPYYEVPEGIRERTIFMELELV